VINGRWNPLEPRPTGTLGPNASAVSSLRDGSSVSWWTVGVHARGGGPARTSVRLALVAAVFVVGLVVGDRLAHHPAAPSSTSESAHHPPAHQEAPPLPYKNPVIATDFPDPDVVWTGAEYVAAATGTSTQHIQFATSRNLVQWKTGSDLLPQLPAWAVNGFGNVWAPDLEHAGGSWILWFSAPTRSSGEQCIGWATSRSVSGPFVTSPTAPAVCQIASGGSIDPSVTTDKSGRHYLLWKNNGNCCGVESRIWSQPLSGDGKDLIGRPTVLLSYSGGWETGPTASESTIEGPSMLRDDGHLFLFFSGGGYLGTTYGMGVAVCGSISGPCRQQGDQPILSSTDAVAGPGGGTAFFDRYGHPWLAYAAWTPPQLGRDPGATRSFRLDRIVTVGAMVFILGPTTDWQIGPAEKAGSI
jgi:Glycosyl hydrolases family 43